MGKRIFTPPFSVGYNGGAGQCFYVHDASGARISAEFRPYSDQADELARILNAGIAALTKPAALPQVRGDEWRCINCKTVVMSPVEPQRCAWCPGREFAHVAPSGKPTALPKEGEEATCATCGFPWGADPVRHAEFCDDRRLSSLPVSGEVEERP